MRCNSINKNVDLCSAVECTAAHPRLTIVPKEEEKSLYVFFCIGASISISREILCLCMRDSSFFLLLFLDKVVKLIGGGSVVNGAFSSSFYIAIECMSCKKNFIAFSAWKSTMLSADPVVQCIDKCHPNHKSHKGSSWYPADSLPQCLHLVCLEEV